MAETNNPTPVTDESTVSVPEIIDDHVQSKQANTPVDLSVADENQSSGEEEEPCPPLTQIFITPQGVDPAVFSNSCGFQQLLVSECRCCNHKKEQKKDKEKKKHCKPSCCRCKNRHVISSRKKCNGGCGSNRHQTCVTRDGNFTVGYPTGHECPCQPDTETEDTEKTGEVIPGTQAFLLFLQAYGMGATMIRNMKERRQERVERDGHNL